MWSIVYIAAHATIIAACVWAVLSPRVNDGLMGCAALGTMAVASLGCIYWAVTWPSEVQRPGALFALAVAGMAVRCWALKTWGPPVRRHIKRRIRKCN